MNTRPAPLQHALVRPALLLLLIALTPVAGLADLPGHVSRVEIEDGRTSIYIGRITLLLEPLILEGDTYRSTYQARVFPYFFFNESGMFEIRMPPEDLRRLVRGETIQFEGAASNHRGKPRGVKGRAVPRNERSGDIKVTVTFGDFDFVFDSTYRMTGDRAP